MSDTDQPADGTAYPVGTVVRSAKGVWHRRVAGHGDLVWQIVATGDKHADRVFKGALRDDAHPVRPLWGPSSRLWDLLDGWSGR